MPVLVPFAIFKIWIISWCIMIFVLGSNCLLINRLIELWVISRWKPSLPHWFFQTFHNLAHVVLHLVLFCEYSVGDCLIAEKKCVSKNHNRRPAKSRQKYYMQVVWFLLCFLQRTWDDLLHLAPWHMESICLETKVRVMNITVESKTHSIKIVPFCRTFVNTKYPIITQRHVGKIIFLWF